MNINSEDPTIARTTALRTPSGTLPNTVASINPILDDTINPLSGTSRSGTGTTTILGKTIGLDFTVTFQLSSEDSYAYGMSLKSEFLEFCGASWQLELFPVGFAEDSMLEGLDARHAKLALYCSEYLHELDISNLRYETTLRHWHDEKASFVHRVDLHGAVGHVGKGTIRWSHLDNRYLFQSTRGYCLPNGHVKYVIHLEATVTDAKYPNHPIHTLADSMREYRVSAADSADITLLASNGERIKAHKFILVARSEFFMAMMSSSMQEANQSEVQTAFSSEVIHALLDYFYTDQCSPHILTTNVVDLLAAANYYQVHGLVEHCERFMCRSICMSNCSQFFYLSLEHSMKDLHLTALSFIEKNGPALRRQLKRSRESSS